MAEPRRKNKKDSTPLSQQKRRHRQARSLPPTPTRRALIVLGMHRSGTSALTRVFNLLGADIARDLMLGQADNPSGHWESVQLAGIHDSLLASAGTNWHDWRMFNAGWLRSDVALSYKKSILDFLENEFAGSKLFAVKDPRICRFVPLWLDVLSDFDATAVPIIPIRNPLEIAASLKQRNGLLPGTSLLIWLRHVLDAEYATRGLTRVFTNYDSLLHDWHQVVTSIASQAKFEWPRRSPIVDVEIDRFLESEQRHHAYSSGELAAREDVSGWVKGAYAALVGLTEGDSRKRLIQLDEIRAEFDQAALTFGSVLAEGENEIAVRTAEVASLNSELSISRELFNSEEKRHAADQHLIDSIQAALAEKQAISERNLTQLEAAKAQLAERAQTAQQLNDELDKARAQAVEHQEEQRTLRAELVRAIETSAQHETARQELAAELEEARAWSNEQQEAQRNLQAELARAVETSAQQEMVRKELAAELEKARAWPSEQQEAQRSLQAQLARAVETSAQRETATRKLTAELEEARARATEQEETQRKLKEELGQAIETSDRHEAAVEQLTERLIEANAVIQKLGAERDRFEAVVSKAHETIIARESDVARVSTRLADALSQLEESRASYIERAASASGVETQLSDVKTVTSHLESENKRIRADLLASQERISERDAEITRLAEVEAIARRERKTQQQKISNLENELATRDTELKASKQDRNRFQDEAKSSRALIDRMDREAELLKSEVERSRNHLRESQSEVQRLLGEVEIAKTELAEAIAERDENAAKLEALIEKIQNTEINLAATQGQLALVAAERDDNASKVNTLTEELQSAQTGLAEANTRLLEVEGSLSESQAELTKLEAALNVAKTEIAIGDQGLQRLQGENDGLRTRIGTAYADMQRFAEENSQLKTSVDASNAALERQNRKATELTSELTHEQLQAKTLRQTISRQSREIAGLVSSRRWRIGEFARVLMRRILRSTSRDFGGKAWEGELILKSRLFDASWYLLQNPDVLVEGADPLVHYVLFGGLENRRPNPLFYADWYVTQYPDVQASKMSPLAHYISIGVSEGLDPNPLFDTDWYLRQNPDVAKAGVNPLLHYLTDGGREGRDPHPLFDGSWYLERNPEAATEGMNPLRHYFEEGAAEGRDPHPLFDSDWYLAQYPDVAASGINPLAHYISRGAFNGYNPNPLFDSAWYLARNPDVAAAKDNPLEHYIAHGAAEGRDPHPLFDTSWYLKKHPAAASNPLVHYLTHGGMDNSLDPHPLFDSSFYSSSETEFATSGENPLIHFLRRGLERRANPHPFFDAKFYVHENPEVAEQGINPLVHYLESGASRGLAPHPLFNTARYLERNPDIATSGLNPLVHFVLTGAETIEEPKAESQQIVSQPPPVQALPRAKTRFGITDALIELLDMYHGRDGIDAVSAAFKLLNGYGDIERDLLLLPEIESFVAATAALAASVPTPEKCDASIIIPVHDKLIYTLACVRSLLLLKTKCSFEILIADDLSNDGTEIVFQSMGDAIRHIRQTENLGFNRNCNAAAKLARGRVVIMLNNDTIALPGWLDELVNTLDNDGTIGMVGSKLVNADGSLQEAGGILWSDGSAWNFGRGDNACACQYNYLKDVDYMSGASIALPRQVWEDLGGFDDLFAPAYNEDSDLAFRVRKAGLRVVYQPMSALIHHEGVSHGRDTSTGIKSYQKRNAALFFERWKDVLASENFPNGTHVIEARDRSRGRPRILLVDHYPPQPDRDAGSRTIFAYLKLFAESGFHVIFWPHNLYFDPVNTPRLQRLGIETYYGGWKNTWPSFDGWLQQNGGALKYAFLSRPGVAVDFVDALRKKTSAKILFYGHDIHFKRLEMEYALSRNEQTKAEMETTKALEELIWSKCDVIYYPSVEETDYVLERSPGKSAYTLPPYIYDQARLDRTSQELQQRGIPKTHRLLFVAGFRHAPNVDAMLWFCAEIWPRIAAEAKSAHLYVVGSEPPPAILDLASSNITVTGAVSDDQLATFYRQTNVAVVPLRFGAGVKGKLIEALSYGTPVVTTQIGVQGIPDADQIVDLCDDALGFAARVLEILHFPERKIEQALRGLDFVRQNASESAAKHIIGKDVPEIVDFEKA